jgi:hypothetical protein
LSGILSELQAGQQVDIAWGTAYVCLPNALHLVGRSEARPLGPQLRPRSPLVRGTSFKRFVQAYAEIKRLSAVDAAPAVDIECGYHVRRRDNELSTKRDQRNWN